MPTSGSYNFAPDFADVLTEAWERCGLSPAIMTGDHARSARRSMTAFQIDWANRGPDLWRIEREDTTVNAGTALLNTPPGTIDIFEMWVQVGGLDLVLTGVSRDEFAAIPKKTQTGRPTQYWSERRTNVPVIHLWPVPDKTYALTINRLRLPYDVSAMSQTPDAPILWMEAIYSELAARLAQKFAPARRAEMRADADRAYASAAAENRERVPLTLLPDFRR